MLPLLRRSLTASGLALGVVALTALPASATTTADIPVVRDTVRTIAFANGIVAPAQISFDIGMKAKDGTTYYPCANKADPVSPACSVGNYYHVVNVSGSADLRYGLPIYNADKGYTHNWSRRVSQANLEITGKDSAGAYGKARLTLTGFDTPYEGDPSRQTRTASTGVIPLPKSGAPDSGRVAGYVRRGSTPVTSGVNLNYFGHTDTGHRTSSGNWVAYGLAGAAVNGSGYYTTTATWNGSYDLSLLYGGHRWVCGVSVRGGVRVDYDVSRSDLGHPGGCTQKY